jgi:hypothetical protein
MTLTFVAVLTFGAPEFTTNLAQWATNLIIAAPAVHQPYMDSPNWSPVAEMTFYGWVTVLITVRLFPRCIDFIVLAWLWISLLKEMTIDARAVELIFLADDSGFFATGLLIYEFYRNRRDAVLHCLLAASIGLTPRPLFEHRLQLRLLDFLDVPSEVVARFLQALLHVLGCDDPGCRRRRSPWQNSMHFRLRLPGICGT